MHRYFMLTLPLVALFSAGCWITFEDGEGWGEVDCPGGCWDSPDYNDCDGNGDPDGPALPGSVCVPGEVRYCDAPVYCSWATQTCLPDGNGWGPCLESSPPPGCEGYGYDPECCVDAGACCQDYYDFDGDGDWNDSIGNCQEPPTPCREDADCADGYCDAEDGAVGRCVETGSCTSDDDCEAFGPGLACDDRGICSPEQAPCPSGNCGCTSDSECDEGLLCIESRCTPPSAICFFDFECDEGERCLDNQCHRSCADDDTCPGGQICIDGLCVEPEVGGDGCVYDEDCGESGFLCVNASCLTACDDDSACGEGEICRAGACRADMAPTHECASDDECPTDMSCHLGTCRLPCVADINCSGELGRCGDEGYCVAAAEESAECHRATDCPDGRACLDGQCVAL